MARYFTKKITIEELANNLEKTGMKRDYKYLTPQVSKDLSKVDFDMENFSDSGSWTFGNTKNPDFPANNYVGYHTLSNGLSYLGINAGGDWEWPIFFIIYHDGNKLRGYIPKDGNTWNYLNSSAFGNDEEVDEKALKQRGLKDMEDLEFDFEKIENDILNRIVFRGAKA
jgi:hypothetical protein